MTDQPPKLRPLLGKVTYIRADHALDDPELELKRRGMIAAWRRGQIRNKALNHIKRVANEYGLAQSIRELFDRNGLPPRNVSLGTLMRQYRQLKKQEGWLAAINEELRARLKGLDLARFHREQAEIAGCLRARREDRAALYDEAIDDGSEGSGRLPPKLAAAIREAIALEITPRERANNSRVVPEHLSDILGSRQVQKMMKYVFTDYLPEGDTTVPSDQASQYDYLTAALNETESLLASTRMNIYELREFIESADLVAMGKA